MASAYDSLDIKQLLTRAHDSFDQAISSTPADGWGRPTPCGDWDLQALVNHVVNEDRWVPPLLAGATIEAVGDRFDGDLLGDDPLDAWRDASQQALAAWAEVPLDRRVHLSIGDFPASEYAWQLFSEHLIHGWDVAVAASGAPTRLDLELVDACAVWFDEWEERYREYGVIDSIPVSVDADPQTRLLARFGRMADAPLA